MEKQTLKANEYQCAQCGGIFEKGWSDEEANKEAKEKFPNLKQLDSEIVCDDCYKELISINEN